MATKRYRLRAATIVTSIATMVATLLSVPAPAAYASTPVVVVGSSANRVWWIENALVRNQAPNDLVPLIFYEKTLQQMYLNDPTLNPVAAARQLALLQKAVTDQGDSSLISPQGDGLVAPFLGLVQMALLTDPRAKAAVEAAKITFQYFKGQTSDGNSDAQVTGSIDLNNMSLNVYGQAFGTLSETLSMAKDEQWANFRTAQNMSFAARTAPTSATTAQLLDANPTLQLMTDVNGLISTTGEIKTDVEHLTTMATTQFGIIQQQQQEAQDTLDNLVSLQNDVLGYVRDADTRAREQAAAQAKATHEQQVLAAASASVSILSELIGLGDPKGARIVAGVGNAAIQIAGAVSKFAELASNLGGVVNALGSLAGAALTGNIVGAVFSMLPLFTGAKDPNEQILEQIGQLQNEVHDLGNMMTDRFNHIDQTLNTVFSTMESEFGKLDFENDVIRGGVTDAQSQLISLSNQLNGVEGGLWSSLSDGFRRPFWDEADYALGYRARTHHSLPPGDFTRADSAFYSWSTHSAYDEASTGPHQRPVAEDILSGELAKYGLDVNVNYLAALPSALWQLEPLSRQALPNPNDWMLGARAYIALAEDYPALAQRNHAFTSEIRTLHSEGLSLQEFERRISGGPNTQHGTATLNRLFATLLDRYDANLDLLGSAVTNVESSYKANVAHLDPTGGLDQELPLAKDRTTLDCPSAVDSGNRLTIEQATFDRLDPDAMKIAEFYDSTGSATTCQSGAWTDFEDHTIGHRELLTAALTATVTSSWNGTPVLAQSASLGTYTLCSQSTFEPPQPCTYPNAATMVRQAWESSAKPKLAAETGVDVLNSPVLQAVHDAAVAHLASSHRAMLATVGDSFTSDPAVRDAAAALTGVVTAIRSYVEVGLPNSVAGDEVLSAMLLGDQRMLDEDGAGRFARAYVDAASQGDVADSDPWDGLRTLAKQREDAFAKALAGDLATIRGGNPDGSLATASTLQRLEELRTTVLTPGVRFAGSPRYLRVAATRVRSARRLRVVVANPGLGRLAVTRAGARGAGLSVVANNCGAVAGRRRCSVVLRFAPARRGVVRGLLGLVTNTDRGRVTLPVKARATR